MIAKIRIEAMHSEPRKRHYSSNFIIQHSCVWVEVAHPCEAAAAVLVRTKPISSEEFCLICLAEGSSNTNVEEALGASEMFSLFTAAVVAATTPAIATPSEARVES